MSVCILCWSVLLSWLSISEHLLQFVLHILSLYLFVQSLLHLYFFILFILSSYFCFSYAYIYLITFILEGRRKDSTVHLGICFSCAYANNRFEPLNLWFFEFVWFGLCSSCLWDDPFTNWSVGESPCWNKVSDSTYSNCRKDPLCIHTCTKNVCLCKDVQSLKSKYISR